MKKLLTLLLMLLAVTTMSAATKAVFLTGGQSNTDGRLYGSTLPDYLQSANSRALVSYHAPYSANRLGVFYPYYPTSETTGQPGRWAYDAVTYYYIAQALNEEFYVAKTSYGGTSIDPSISNSPSGHDNAWLSGYGAGYHWSADPTFLTATAMAGTTFEKDGTTYDGQSMLLAWIANIDATLDAITTAGDTPDIKAIIWHQGESDKNAAGSYYNNLKAMVAYVRNHIVKKTGDSKYATLPFFCGTIPHASSLASSGVEKAFFTLEDEDANFHVVDLRDLTMLSDTKHFDAPSAELFGKRLYNRMVDEGVISGDKLDVEYAQVDYSDFGTDEFVGETNTWNFDNQSGSFYSGSKIVNSIYFHGGGSTQRRFEFVTGQTAQSLSYPDSYVQNATSYVRCNLGSNINESSITDTWNASHSGGNCFGVNVLYPGTFTMKVAIEDVDKNVKLYFNGKLVGSVTCTTANAIQEISYSATAAGTYYVWTNGPYKLWGARYVPTIDRTAQRRVTTDADGYATFGNITGANLGLPTGLTAWAVAPSTEKDELVEMTQLLGVDKNTGALLQGEPNTEYTLPFVWTAVNYEGENDMTAQQTTGDVEENSGEDFINYTFTNKQFTKVSTPISVAAGKAYLSISNGVAHSANATLTFDEPEAEAATDSGHDFGTEVVVGEARTWTLDAMTLPTYQDTEAVEYNGLYGKAQGGSNNRSWKSGNSAFNTTFSDGTAVSGTKYFTLNNDAGSSSTSATATAASAGLNDYLAINTLYPGTFYVLVSSNGETERTHTIYFNGTAVANKTTTSSTIEELKYTATEAGTFVYHSGKANARVHALRFVPTDDQTALRQATMGADGYAVFTNLALASLTLPEGLSAYALQAGEIDADAVKQVEATVIGKGEAVLLKGAANETYTMTIDNTQTSVIATENYLQPVLAWQKPLANNTETGNAQYVFDGSVFNKADGKTKVLQGEAILSVPASDAMAAYSIVKLNPITVDYDFVDVYTMFGNDEVVSQETIWLTGNMTTPSSDGTVQQLNGLYGRGQSGSNNRSFFKNNASGSATFSDGTKVSWSSYLYINADYSGSWSLSASTHANNTTCGDYLAFNAAVPGTVYVLFSSKDASQERTLDLYYEGTKAASATSTGSSDIQEIKYDVTAAGTLVLDCRKTCRVYALRFVPAEAGVYTRVTPIGWGTMSLPYPAVVPDGTCVYYVSNYEDGAETGTLTLTKVEAGDVIPAKQGFLFNGVKGLYRFAKSLTTATWTDNLLTGTADGALTDYDSSTATDPIYVLAQLDDTAVGFKKFSGSSIARYKAYLQVGSGATARAFRIIFDDVTALSPLSADSQDASAVTSVYTLSGVQQQSLVKGVNILRFADGTSRKVLVK